MSTSIRILITMITRYFLNPLKLIYFFIIHIRAFFAREALIVSSDEETTRNELITIHCVHLE